MVALGQGRRRPFENGPGHSSKGKLPTQGNVMPHSIDSCQHLANPDISGLPALCDDLFSSFARSDQRRWGEIYVHGLLTVPGRKSMKRISDLVAGGGAEQCLQQFINQSTWEWEVVRRDLAHRLVEPLQPQALIVKEVVFPKNGDHSVGVARQFAQSVGRMLNCQLGIVVFLAGPAGSCPVNWRLLLPPAWDSDHGRRTRAHLPDHEHHGPKWQQVVEVVDETVRDWRLPSIPIVVDMRHDGDVSALAQALEAHGLNYVLRVSANRPAVTVRPTQAAPRTLSFADVISGSTRSNALIRWHLASQRPGGGQLIATRLPNEPLSSGHESRFRPAPARPRPHSQQRRSTTRHVAAEWPSTRRGARTTWLTTLDASALHQLPDYISLHDRISADLEAMYDLSGLRHFEGRSFSGWHHHVTLVSVAHAWQYLDPVTVRVGPVV